MYRIQLSFAQIRCVRCGEARIRGVSCWNCGATPDDREVDPDRARRQRLARELIGTLESQDAPAPQGEPIRSPEHVFDELAAWIERFLGGLAHAVESRESETDVVAAVEDLVSLRRRLHGAVRLRPWLLVWRGIDDLVQRVEHVAASFLRAIEASTPIEGQRWAKAGQEALDAAGDEAAELGRRLDAYVERERLLEEGGLPALINQIAGPAQGNILELDASGRALYERLTGDRDCPPGLGGGLRLTGLQADLLMDPDRFWDLATKYTRALLSRRNRFAALFQDDEWRSDMRDASLRTQDAGLAHEALVGVARHDRHRVQAALTLLHSLSEGPIRRYSATLLAVTGGLDYRRQRFADLGALMQRARQAGLASVADGVDIVLRGARAHEEYEVTDDAGLILRRGGPVTTIPSDEVLDRFLACLEVALALSTAVAVGAVAAGPAGAELLTELLPLDLPTEEGVLMGMAFAGWTDLDVVVEENEVSVTGVVVEVQAQHLVQLLPYVGETVQLVRLIGRTPSGEGTLVARLDPWRRWRAAADEDTKSIAFTEAMASSEVNGERAFSEEQVRKWAAVFALKVAAEGADLRSTIARLRELRDMANRVGDPALADAAAMLLSLRQANETGLPPPGSGVAAINQLREWGSARVTFR